MDFHLLERNTITQLLERNYNSRGITFYIISTIVAPFDAMVFSALCLLFAIKQVTVHMLVHSKIKFVAHQVIDNKWTGWVKCNKQ